jgi:ribonuclease HI
MITVFADASVCNQTKASGWGAWYIADGLEAVLTGGAFQNFTADVTAAELEALANALAHAEQTGALSSNQQVVMLQSDSVGALSVVRQKMRARDSRHANGVRVPFQKKQPNERQSAAVDVIAEIIGRNALRVVVRHVRGHTKGRGRRWVNRQCDRLANEGRRKAAALQEVAA